MFWILLRKEWMESLRTHRLLILAVVLVAFGLFSPVSARFTPEIIKLAAGDQQGIEALMAMIPTPTAPDAVDQYLKNLSQIGMLVIILLMMGLVAREKELGTAVLVLARPVSRGSFLLAKFLTFLIILLLCLAVAGAACYLYTFLLFSVWLPAGAFLAINGLIALYMLIPTAFAFLGSTLSRNNVVAAGLGLVGWLGLGLLGNLHWLRDYSPGRLTAAAAGLARGMSFADWPAVVTGLALVLLCLILSGLSFQKQEL